MQDTIMINIQERQNALSVKEKKKRIPHGILLAETEASFDWVLCFLSDYECNF